MKREEWYELGQQMRYFFAGLTGASGITGSDGTVTPDTNPDTSTSSATDYIGRYGYGSGSGPSPLTSDNLIGQCDTAALLKPGHLLVVTKADNVCYQLDPETGQFRYLFELQKRGGIIFWRAVAAKDGTIYCTLSATKTPLPIIDVEFGKWGTVVRVNHRRKDIKRLAFGGEVVDPYSIQLLPDNRLLIADFDNFGGSGKIYTVDRFSGALQVIAKGGILKEPTTAMMDEDGIIWIANGDQASQDGELLRLDPQGNIRVVVPRHGQNSGTVLGVFRSNKPNEVIAIKNDWDERVRSAVMLVNKETGEVVNLLEASTDEPRFFSTASDVRGDTLWVAELCNKLLFSFDLNERKITKTIDLSVVMGGYRGMRNSFDSVSVSVVPEDVKNPPQ